MALSLTGWARNNEALDEADWWRSETDGKIIDRARERATNRSELGRVRDERSGVTLRAGVKIYIDDHGKEEQQGRG